MTKFVAQVALKNNNALVSQHLTKGGRVRAHMELGRITALFRYPVKSMAGELLDMALRVIAGSLFGDSMTKAGSHGSRRANYRS
jgi:hypothetical protein